MKFYMSLLLITFSIISVKSTYAQQYATKDDIAVILKEIQSSREDMKTMQVDMRKMQEDIRKMQEAVREMQSDITMGFNYVEKRLEQVDKRFEFIQMLLVAVFVASIGSPFLSRWLDRKREDNILELERLLIALKEYARQDEKMKEIFRNAKLL
ncbi:MAG: hypothetical protein HZA00_09000 [Nitrospinae bacterium]|nr:hypothetical protein [Nitrospinota bacterium]